MKLNRKNLLLAASATITIAFTAPSAHAASGTWNVDASGDWSLDTNWSPVAVPGTTAGDVIGLTNNITADSIVTIDTTSRTAGILNLGDSDDTHAFTLAASGGAGLTLDNSGGGAQINKTGIIADAISAPIIMAENLAVTAAGALQISGDISGTGTLTKLGGTGGTVLTLSGNNSYSGGTFHNAGQIIASHASALSSTTVTINGGRRLLIDAGLNVANDITISSANGQAGFGVLESRGSGTATLSGDISVTGGIVGGGHFASTSGNDLVLSGVITSSVGGLSQRTGTVTYSGGGTGYGNFSVTGTTKVGAENGIATTGNLTIGGSGDGVLDLNSYNQTLVGITKGGSNATIGSSSITANSVLTTTGTSSYAGTIVDVIPLSGGNRTVGLTVASGALTLSGTNTYTGPTAISGGTLVLGNVSALGTTSAISMAAGATLQANLTGISTAAPITLSGAGNVQIAAGTTTAVAAGFTGGITGTTTTLTFTTVNTGNPSHVITLGATSNYAGDTTITVGLGDNNLTVKAGGLNSLSPTTVLTMGGANGSNTASGRVSAYDLNGNNQTLAGLFNTTVGHITSRNQRMTNSGALATLTIDNSVPYSFGGAHTDAGGTGSAQITGALALTKNGIGTFTLGGLLGGTAVAPGNSFTGDTKILGGTLILGETISIQNSAFDTASSIAGTGSAGLLTTVTALNLGGLSGNKNFADVFTTALGGPLNTTPRGGYDGLTALTLNLATGTTQSYTGNIGEGAPGMTLTKTGLGTQILAGTNTYTGGTTLTTGTLQFKNPVSMPATGAVAVGNATTLVVNVGGPGEWTTGTSGNGTIGGLLGGLGGQGGAVSYTGNITLGLDTTNASPTTQTYPGSIANVGTNLALTKLGTNTLALSGLSATAASNYAGNTTIENGTLAFTTTSPSLTGGLVFGAATTATAGILDLTSANATFAGNLLVQSISTADEIKIGTSQTLTVNGSVQIGASTPAITGTVTKLAMTGGGEFIHNGSTFLVGGAGLQQYSTLDLTGIAKATFTTTGNFRIAPNTGTNNGGQATLLLPTPAVADAVVTTTINVGASATRGLSIGNGGSLFNKVPDFMNTLQLGTGLTTINTPFINIASNPVSGNLRDVGQLIYGQANIGDLKIRGADGVTRAGEINLGVNNTLAVQTTGSSALTAPVLFDTSGHDADIFVTSLNLGGGLNRVGAQVHQFKFGEQTTGVGVGSLASKLDVTNVNIGNRSAGNSSTATQTFLVDISGGTVLFGNVGATGTGVDLGNSAYNQAGVATFNAELNITGGIATLHNGTGGFAVRLGQSTAANSGIVNATMNLTGGTTTLTGDIVRGTATGTVNSALKLAGGSLDMGGNDIGAAGLGAVTLTAESGTLSNVLTINGTGGLTKTTVGTLTVSGTNTYTGATTISDGTLALGANNALPANPVSIGTATLNASTFDDNLGTLDVTGSAVINLDAGANLVFANSSAITWTGPNLNITGTFVSNSSLNFGPGGLSPAQLALISVNGAGTGTYTLNGAGFLIAPAGGANYASWAIANGIPGEPASGDFDNDGLTNLVEYALGKNPTSSSQPAGVLLGNVITYTKGSEAITNGDVSWVIETSTTLALGSWTPEPVVAGPTVSYTFTPSTPTKKFARLKVTQIP